ncbi:MAG: phosphopantetheine-binding protein [Ezakiella sp.]|nr:phosphopantetheine-binding protein [Ezakiella sp.]MDD7471201.1 phosphopantetheine-binding protein [Bacillota bacterium]MDY3923338.1 phosphopantetheine-binding protein [Ezakiella sp.]
MKEQIIKIISDLVPDFENDEESKLLDDGILDSFDIVSLVMELNEEFDVDINVMDITEDNFNTVDTICELVRTKLDE